MHRKEFADHKVLQDYAEAHDLEYYWERMHAFQAARDARARTIRNRGDADTPRREARTAVPEGNPAIRIRGRPPVPRGPIAQRDRRANV
jgi:hypothetical protein